jgi:hypothetical protein
MAEEDLRTFDLRPLLSQNTSPDQIPLLRLKAYYTATGIRM